MCTVVLQFASTAICAPSWTNCLCSWNPPWESTHSCRSHHNLYSCHLANLANFPPFNTCHPNTENNSAGEFFWSLSGRMQRLVTISRLVGINMFWTLAVALPTYESSSQKSISTIQLPRCSLPIAFNTLKCYRKLTLVVPQETDVLITKADSNAPALASFQWQIPVHAGNEEVTVASSRCPNTKHRCKHRRLDLPSFRAS